MRLARSICGTLFMAGVVTSLSISCTEPTPLPQFNINYRADGPYADPALFSAEVNHGGWRGVFGPQQLTVRAQTASHVEAGLRDLPLRAGEPVTVRIAVVLASGDTAAAGSVSWTAEKDWGYSVTGEVGPRPPHGFCVISVSAAGELPPRAGTSGDSLFLVLSGLRKNTVC